MQNSKSSNRLEWIDSARVLATLVVMLWHLTNITDFQTPFSNSYIHHASRIYVFDGCVAFFFVTSGYFAAKNINMGKALKRAFWIFIPFFLWNLFYFTALHGQIPTNISDISALIGLKNIFSPKLCLNKDFVGCPVDCPTWFLRDLVVLTLLTPLFNRFSKFLPACIIIFASSLKFKTDTGSEILLAPSHLAYYLVGVCACSVSPAVIRELLSRQGKYIAIACFGYAVCIHAFYHLSVCVNFIGRLTGAALFLYLGILLEEKTPRISHIVASWGPLTFLAYVAHWPFYHLVKGMMPPASTANYCMLFLPLVTFALVILCYKLLEKYAPQLLPYIAYSKAPKKKEI